MDLSITITSLFHIPSQGTVLSGTIDRGELSAGMRVTLTGPNESVQSTVHGIEIDRTFVTTAHTGQVVGLLFKDIDPTRLNGVEKSDDGHYKVTLLEITKGTSPWWKFW